MDEPRTPNLLLHPRYSERLLYYEGTRTLINKFEIRDPTELARAERTAVSQSLADVQNKPVQPTFDLAHLKEIHRRLFEPLYPFAGQFSPPQTAKFNSSNAVAGSSQTVAENVESLLREIRDPVLESHSKNEFVLGIADAFTTFHLWRPFVRGNGITGRVFIAQLSHAARYEFDFSRVDRTRWLDANLRADAGEDSVDLITLILSTARPLHAAAFEQAMKAGDATTALRHFPQLQPVFNALDAMQQKLTERLVPDSPSFRRASDRLIRSAQRELDAGKDPQQFSEAQLGRLLLVQRGFDR